MTFAIFWGAGVALIGLGMLITGSASINEGWIVLSKRQARIAGAASMVLGLCVVSGNVLVETGWFEAREIVTGVFLVFFVMVAVLASIMTGVQLVGWVRTGEGVGEVRKRALIAGFVLVFQLGFLIFVGMMLASYYGYA